LPDPVLLSPKAQLNTYGAVPPVTVAMKVCGLFTTPLPPKVNEATRGCGPTITVADPAALAPFESVTVKVSTAEPFVGAVLENVPVPW